MSDQYNMPGQPYTTGGTIVPEPPYYYEAFISYRHIEPDMSVAKALHKSIEGFSIPASIRKKTGRGKIGKVFRDQEELPTSSNLGENIENALINSKWLILVCSPAFPESKWCMREVDYFIELGRRDRIRTVLTDGEPRDSFPPQIRFNTSGGIQEEVEPLAADVRARTMGARLKKLRREKLRILAPMLGVGFDELFQRSRRNLIKNISLAAAAAAAAAVILAFFIGSVIEDQALNTADEQIKQLLLKANGYVTDGMQPEAVLAAREACEIAKRYNLDEQTTSAALYGALVEFPVDRSYIKLTANADIETVEFSPDGSQIAILSTDKKIKVYDTGTAILQYVIQLEPDNDALMQVESDKALHLTGCRWCSFCFDDKNQLFVLDALSHKLEKYDPAGNLVFSEDNKVSYGIDIDYFDLFDKYAIYRSSIKYLKDADALIVAGYYGDSTKTSKDAGCFAFSAANGATIWEQNFSDDFWPIKTELSFDGSSAAAYIGVYPHKILIFKAANEKGVSVEIYEETYLESPVYLYDSFLLTVIRGEIAVLDLKDGNSYAATYTNYGYRDSDESVPVLLPCAKPGDFIAGWSDETVSYYNFDGTTVEFLDDLVYGDFAPVQDGYFYRYGWGEKDNGTFACIYPYSDKTAKRLMVGDGVIYRNYDYSHSSASGYLYSGTGIYAEYERNECRLFNLKKEKNQYTSREIMTMFQTSTPYVNIDKNIIVVEEMDYDGLCFSMYSIKDMNPVFLTKTWIPETDYFDPDYTSYEIFYGEEYAAVLLRFGIGYEGYYGYEYEDEDEDEDAYIYEDEFDYSLYIFYYDDEDEIAEFLCEFEGYKSSIKAITEKGVIVLDSSNTSNSVFTVPPDFAGTIEDLNKKSLSSLNPDAIWTKDGKSACFLDPNNGIGILDIESMSDLPVSGLPDGITSVKEVGGNTLALTTVENEVIFFDINTLEQNSTTGSSEYPVTAVTLNAQNGLVVISRSNGYEIFDPEKGETVLGPYLYNTSVSTGQIYTCFISNDMKYLVYARQYEGEYYCPYYEEEIDTSLPAYWTSYGIQRLMDADQLLQESEKYLN